MSVAVLAEDDSHAACGGVWVSPESFLTAFHCVKHNGQPVAANDALSALLGQLGLSPATPPWDPTGQVAHYQVRSSLPLVAVIERIDRDNDLALLKAPAPPVHQVAHLAVGDVVVGESLDVVGSTAGVPYTYSRCYVAGERAPDPDEKTFKAVMVTGPVYLGNSGGGAFDEHGGLVGIADYMIGDEFSIVPGVSFFVHRDVIKDFLGAK